MVQDRKPADDKRNLSRGKLSHQFVPVRVLPIQDGEVHPPAACSMDALQLVRYPLRLLFFVGKFCDSNLLAFGPVRAQEFLWKIRAHRILSDHLRCHSQDVWRATVIFCQADTEARRVPAGFPCRKFFEKELKASKRGPAKAVDGLVVVADRENVSRLARQQLQQSQLRDVGVLKFVDEDIAIALLQRFPQRRIVFQQGHSPSNQRSERDSLFLS
jgi:hypothetical protein